jgi:hypothetical protein
MSKALPLLLALPLALLAGGALAKPDAYVTGKIEADDFQGVHQAPGGADPKVEIWIGADRASRRQAGMTTILRLDQKRLYRIDSARRIYVVQELRNQGSLWEPVPKKNDVMTLDAEAQELMRPHFTLLPSTPETRKIGSWQAKRYEGKLESQLESLRTRLIWWLAPEVKIDDRAYRQLLLVESPALAPLLENPGFPVLCESFAQQPGYEVKSSLAIQKIETREPPAGVYDPPAGYRLVDMVEFQTLPE